MRPPETTASRFAKNSRFNATGMTGIIRAMNIRTLQHVQSASATSLDTPGTVGALNYLVESVKPSLYRNGEVLTRRDRDGSDGGTEGVLKNELEVAVNNARLLAGPQRRTIETHGFELLTRSLARSDLEFYDHQQVVQEYYAECAQVVQEATGAARVFAFDHNIRSATGKESKKRIAGGQQVQGPARIVHGDYTLTSGPQRLRDLANPPDGNDTLRSVLDEGESLLEPDMVERALDANGRFAIIFGLWAVIAGFAISSDPATDETSRP
jgi:hypothetical protein